MIAREKVELHPLAEEHAPALRALHAAREVWAWWGEMDARFPFDEPEVRRYALVVDGEVAGLIQWGEETEPEFRHAWIDIFLGPEFAGRGIGTEAVSALARHLHDVEGHHRIVIDPALDNRAAIRAYEKAGFRAVGVTEASWRDPAGVWRDSLFMERVERPAPDGRGWRAGSPRS